MADPDDAVRVRDHGRSSDEIEPPVTATDDRALLDIRIEGLGGPMDDTVEPRTEPGLRAVLGAIGVALAVVAAIALISRDDDTADSRRDGRVVDGIGDPDTEITPLAHSGADGAGHDQPPSPRLLGSSARDGLVDGQSVTLHVFNIAGARTLDLQLCPRDTPRNVECPKVAALELDGSDSYKPTVALPRLTIDPATSQIFDCAESCTVRVFRGTISADLLVSFDPRSAFLPPPTLEHDGPPAAPGDRVTVTGAGFPEYSALDPALRSSICGGLPPQQTRTAPYSVLRCGQPERQLWEVGPVIEADGSFSGVLIAPETTEIPLSPGRVHSCFPGPCWLVIETSGQVAGATIASVELTAG
jgi:hypothetical protein